MDSAVTLLPHPDSPTKPQNLSPIDEKINTIYSLYNPIFGIKLCYKICYFKQGLGVIICQKVSSLIVIPIT